MESTSVAYSEVYEILKHTPEELFNKIPDGFIKTIETNRNANYQFIYNKEKPLNEQNISRKAKALLAVIYCAYWSSIDERNKAIQKFKENENEYQKELNEKYDVNKAFERNRNRVGVIQNEETDMEEASNEVLGSNNIRIQEEGSNAVKISADGKEITLYKKETFWDKIVNWIKNKFSRKD